METLDPFFPPYLLPDSPEISNWAERNPGGWRKTAPATPIQQVSGPEAHKAAADGDIERLQKTKKSEWSKKDINGWQPIHEAARSGHTDIVKMLLDNGIDKDVRTGHLNEGQSPLSLALEFHDEDHELVSYLRSIGAKQYEYSEEL